MRRSVPPVLPLLALLLAPAASAQVPADAFADSLAGTWAGTLRAWGPRGEQAVAMRMEIARADTAYTFTVTYGEDDRRAYSLVVRDGAAGRYAIDEGAGLVLDAFRRGDALVTVFLAGENRIVSLYERTRDAAGPLLRFEIVGTPAAPITRNELPSGDPLHVYDVGIRQQALLRRAPGTSPR